QGPIAYIAVQAALGKDMNTSPLHVLAQKIGRGEPIENSLLLDTLGRDGTIVVPLHHGGERRLPSGEILSVLADSAGLTIEQVLARSFGMDPEETEPARTFIQLVQFAGESLQSTADE